jgi:membrane dipeptidase
MTTLTWNEKNPLAGSHLTGGGLTDQGREYVKEAQLLGMRIDVSHLSDEGFWDIMKITDAPVVASHSNSRSFCNVSRNLTDDMFKAICQTGGIAGFNFCAAFVGENPSLDTVCDHIFHLLELDPDCRHLALGGDLDGCDNLPVGMDGIQSYPVLAQRLLERGLSENNLRNFYWNNAMGVMSGCCM